MIRINRSVLLILLACLGWVLLAGGRGLILASEEPGLQEGGCADCVHADHDDEDDSVHEHEEADHDQEGHLEEDGHDDHEDEHAGHAHDEHVIQLDSESQKLIGLETVKARVGSLSSVVRLTGQIKLNEDRMAHIVPLTSGIVRKVNNTIGEPVEKDDILAWIESSELAQAKVHYLDIQAEIGCCAMNLTRAQEIHDNTLKLIEMLQTGPSLDELQQYGKLAMGQNSSKLIESYAEYKISQTIYEREKALYDKKVSSGQEYQHAENRFRKAESVFLAMLDTIQFQVKQDLLETLNDQRRQEIALKGAERTLYVLGQNEEDIRTLDALVTVTSGSESSVEACADPNCEECQKKAKEGEGVKASESDYHYLGWYPLRAAFAGTVIDKHITLGERLSVETAAFTIADLTTVWVDLDVFGKDLSYVKRGQGCRITFGDQSIDGEIGFVSPILNTKTRTATARVILANPDGSLRPGQFVTGIVYGQIDSDRLVVPVEAVQVIEGERCVFVQDGEDFEACPVVVGRSNQTDIEIVSGVTAGQLVVTKGAFDLKAKIVTSTLDSHAGHGH